MNIIIKKGRSERQESGKYFVIRTPAQAARASVSRQNRQEYDNEKRAKELAAKMKGPMEQNAVAIAKMMSIDEHKAKKLISKKSKGVVLDGKID